MRRRTSTSPDLITKVNVTPIIDVALVLVIILLVTAPMITATDLRIKLPEAHTRTAEDQRNVSITLGPDGDLRLDQKPVPTGKLRQALQARLAQPGGEDDLVIVCADAGVHYGKVNAILDEARQAGAKRLAIATQHKADDRKMNFDLVRRDAEATRVRTRRALGGSLVAHALILTWLVFFAGKSEGPPTITEVTWLDPKDLEPPKPKPAPVAAAQPLPPAPKPAPVAAAQPKPAPKPQVAKPVPAPVRPAGKANIADKAGDSGIARAPAPSGGGEKGRAAGARVAKEVAQTAASIDNVLSNLSGTVPVAGGTSGGGGGKKVNDRFAVAGGRGDGALPTSEGDLRGSGVGAVGAGGGAGGGKGSGRGVQKTAVAIVDNGVESEGDGAGAAGRDSRSLMAVVQRYVAGVKFCYDNALKKNPGLSGKITLQMDITAPGAVTNLDPVDDSMGNAALERCILSQVEGWKFPVIPAGTVRFTLPLVFTPPQGVTP